MVTQKINLNLIPGGVLPRVKLSQYDHQARYIEITLYSGVSKFTVPSGCVVYVQGTKRDKTGFQYTCSVSGAVVTAQVTEQMCAFAGDVMTELVIMQGTNRIGTGNFVLDVEKSALADDTVISETELPIIQDLPNIVADLSESVQTTIDNAKKAQDSVDEAKTYAAKAAQSVTDAETAKAGAETARDEAEQHEKDAETEKKGSETAKEEAETAKAGAETARDEAKQHAKDAEDSANDSKDYSDLSKSYAIGTNGETRAGDETDNSKYYSEQSRNSATSASASEKAAKDAVEDAQKLIDDALSTNIPNVWIDFDTGLLMWEGGKFVFDVDTATGNLMWEVAA